MIRDIIDHVCPQCGTTPRRLEVLDLGRHTFWLVRCRCATALLLVVSDGSPIDFNAAKRAA